MIVESKAIEPKANSANSTYYAVILRVIKTYSNNSLNLQVFCPDVMSGSPNDALAAVNNIIEAPIKPHSGDNVEPYDYKVGGVVVISYQNGNVNSPQFVRFVEIEDSIVEINKAYIKGVPITSDIPLFDLGNISDVDLGTIGLQKGVTLLPALKKCAPTGNIFHAYGFDAKSPASELKGKQYLTIYRCGSFGTEFVFKRVNNFLNEAPEEANFDYFDNLDSGFEVRNKPLLLINSFITSKSNSDELIIDAVNKAIKNFTPDSKTIYDKTNLADALFWYTKLAGYIYSDSDKYDQSDKISAGWKENITTNNINKTLLKQVTNPELSKVLNQGVGFNDSITLYRGTFRTDSSSDDTRNYTFNFIKELWTVLSKDNYFEDRMSVYYAAVLTNNLMNLKTTYNVKSLTNKTLVICSVIASAFPVLENVIMNFRLADELLHGYYTDSSRLNKFIKAIINGMEQDAKLNYTAEELAEHFTDLYFQVLNWPMSTSGTKLFKWVDNPDIKIKQMMLNGINYILNNYNSLSQTLDDNENNNNEETSSGFIWPVPTCHIITSPYGNRIHPTKGTVSFHTGIDIGCVTGSNIVASASGTVSYVSMNYSQNTTGNSLGYGNQIVIKHSNGYQTRYGHMLSANVSVGDKVSQGQVIGKSDNTGASSGPHLHFEIIKNGNYENPSNYVK